MAAARTIAPLKTGNLYAKRRRCTYLPSVRSSNIGRVESAVKHIDGKWLQAAEGGFRLEENIAAVPRRPNAAGAKTGTHKGRLTEAGKSFRKHWQLYLLVLPPVLFFLIFKYYPMANMVLAFKEYNVIKGIWGSPWVGLKNFKLFFDNPAFWDLFRNTLLLSFYLLAVTFPIPIILALMLNEVRSRKFKRFVQLVTFAPYFISTVVMVSIIMLFLAPRLGFANVALNALGFDSINFLGNPGMFRSIYVWSDIWQTAGYLAVIYLAALAGVDPSLYEAARVDGASRFQKILNVDLPGILPTIVVVLILTVGNVMALSFEKVYLLQNPLNTATSEVIATYVYKIGLLNANYSFATAVGMFNSFVNLILLVVVNGLAKRFSNNSIW